MTYKTLTHVTCNEAGQHEVEIVYANGIFRELLGLPERTETYVGQGGTFWFRKGSGERAGTMKEWEICNIVERLRQAQIYKRTIG